MNNNKKNKVSFHIDTNKVSKKSPVYVIAEIGQAHDGSLGSAHAYIDAVSKIGVQAIKFQTHIAEEESSKYDTFRKKFSFQDNTRFDYWKRTEFTEEEWSGLYDHAKKVGLTFLSTPFSFKAMDLLENIGVKAWKVGSGETNNLPMLERMAKTKLPVILSSGLSNWKDINDAVKVVEKYNKKIALLQCTTAYPCPPEKLGLNIINEIYEKYIYPCGLSDHSGYIYPSIAAVALKADIIEVHTVFSKECFGPDSTSSLSLEDLKELVKGCRFVRSSMQNEIDKDLESENKLDLKKLFGKSIYTTKKILKGQIINQDNICLKKPVKGIEAKLISLVLGRAVIRDIDQDEPIFEVDLNDNKN